MHGYLELLRPAPLPLVERLLRELDFFVGLREDVASSALISDANCN